MGNRIFTVPAILLTSIIGKRDLLSKKKTSPKRQAHKIKPTESTSPASSSTEKGLKAPDPVIENASWNEAFRRGTELMHAGKEREAIAWLEHAHALDSQDVNTALNLGGAYILTKKFKNARRLLEPVSEQHPGVSAVWTNLGAAYLGNPILARDEEQRQAIEAFKRALELNPIAPSVAYNLGLVHRDRKENDEAIYWFKQAIQHNPNDQDARRILGRLNNIDTKEE